MENLIGTYGKTWHTWHTEQGNALPYGVPQLMMGFTADGQIDSQLVRERDGRMGGDSEAKKRARAGIGTPAIDPGADAWQKGQVWQIKDPTGGHALIEIPLFVARELAPAGLCRSWRSLRSFDLDLSLSTQLVGTRSQPRCTRQLLHSSYRRSPAGASFLATKCAK
jgi:hypothetical protein